MFWSNDIQTEGGPFKVLLKKGEFIDEARGGRVVPYKIYHPADYEGEKLPVILWSHGFGGNRDGAGFLSRFLASYGYIIVHMSHEGTDSRLWEGKGGHPWDILRKLKVPREATLARFKDVPFTLDALEGWAADNPDIGRFMDLERPGIGGHSFGSMTAQVMAGQTFPNEEDILSSYRDERFKAAIFYSPVPIAHISDAPPDALYAPIAVPVFHMTGTEDDSPIENFGYKERLAVHEYSVHPEKHLLIKKGGDHMVYNGTRGKLGRNALRERHEEIINIGSLAFWDAFLKADEKARDWLSGNGFVRWIGEDATYQGPQ
ncbi:MAG: hypothetical protein R3D66_07415 [Alphaproteobacteria bacterium]